MAKAGDIRAGGAFVELGLSNNALLSGLRRSRQHVMDWSFGIKRMIGRVFGALNPFTLKRLFIGGGAIAGMTMLTQSFVKAADKAEQLQLRMSAVLRSSAEGNKLFDDMARFAARVPFEYEHVIEAATALAGVMKGGADEVRKWMPLMADLAAVSGFSLKETQGQFIRMYSAGANAADLFRERGILAMLGFKQGVKITAEETRKKLMQEWTKADSKFRGLVDKLKNTWTGQLSMLKDKWFLFRVAVMKAGPFDAMKDTLKDLNRWMDGWIDRVGAMAEALWKQVTKHWAAIRRTAMMVGQFILSDVLQPLSLVAVGLIAKLGGLLKAALSAVGISVSLDRFDNLYNKTEALRKSWEEIKRTMRGVGVIMRMTGNLVGNMVDIALAKGKVLFYRLRQWAMGQFYSFVENAVTVLSMAVKTLMPSMASKMDDLFAQVLRWSSLGRIGSTLDSVIGINAARADMDLARSRASDRISNLKYAIGGISQAFMSGVSRVARSVTGAAPSAEARSGRDWREAMKDAAKKGGIFGFFGHVGARSQMGLGQVSIMKRQLVAEQQQVQKLDKIYNALKPGLVARFA